MCFGFNAMAQIFGLIIEGSTSKIVIRRPLS